ncbi:hypothetical protein HDU78_007747 [Chytriomyces hyalinus]|nr:hypothetical protein HDU78_007747 [Chytriomyces hyalinus]
MRLIFNARTGYQPRHALSEVRGQRLFDNGTLLRNLEQRYPRSSENGMQSHDLRCHLQDHANRIANVCQSGFDVANVQTRQYSTTRRSIRHNRTRNHWPRKSCTEFNQSTLKPYLYAAETGAWSLESRRNERVVPHIKIIGVEAFDSSAGETFWMRKGLADEMVLVSMDEKSALRSKDIFEDIFEDARFIAERSRTPEMAWA